MADYVAPQSDIRFALDHLVDLAGLSRLEGFEHADRGTVFGLLDEFGRFVSEVLAPLDRTGDTVGSKFDPATHAVTTPPGWPDAYRKYVDAGWGSVSFPAEHGGGGFPWLVTIAMQEMLTASNMAWSLCPLLTQGAIDMLLHHGSEEQQETYLRRMVSAEWTGTMNLTEPQAGSDVGALTTKAVPAQDGSWRISGQKIFITYGEQDITDNIVHLVLARTPDAPPGTRGISCFLVPKFLVNDDGSLGAHNGVTCIGIEHKMGIHASPTCTLEYDDAVGYLIGGEPNEGMRQMFTMMEHGTFVGRALRLGRGRTRVPTGPRLCRRASSGSSGGRARRRIEPDRRPRRRPPHVAHDAVDRRSHARARVRERRSHRPRASRRRHWRPDGRGRTRRPPHARHQRVVHRHGHRARVARRADPRRHGLHRGDGDRPALPRHPHRRDLRRHERHPGDGPRRAQAADAGGWRRARLPRTPRCGLVRPHRRSRPVRRGRRGATGCDRMAAHERRGRSEQRARGGIALLADVRHRDRGWVMARQAIAAGTLDAHDPLRTRSSRRRASISRSCFRRCTGSGPRSRRGTTCCSR